MTSSHGLSRAQIAALVRRSRLSQGLPAHITDRLVLRDVSVLVTATVRRPRAGRAAVAS
jgi:hypothetical protein